MQRRRLGKSAIVVSGVCTGTTLGDDPSKAIDRVSKEIRYPMGWDRSIG